MAKARTEQREELPVVTSYSLVSGPVGWCVLTIQTQGSLVIDVQSTEPDMRAIAVEQFLLTTAKAYFV